MLFFPPGFLAVSVRRPGLPFPGLPHPPPVVCGGTPLKPRHSSTPAPCGGTAGMARPTFREREDPVLEFLGPGSMECQAGRPLLPPLPLAVRLSALHAQAPCVLALSLGFSSGENEGSMLIEGRALFFSTAQAAINTKIFSLCFLAPFIT